MKATKKAKRAKKMKKAPLQKVPLCKVLNSDWVECKSYYDKVNKTFDICDDILDLEDRLDKGEVIIFPTEDYLYPYNEAMRDYLNDNEIEVPSKRKAIGYLAENGDQYDFYSYRGEEVKKRLLTWWESRKIPIEII